MSVYGWGADPKQRESLFYVSTDDGRTWQRRSLIAKDLNETTLLSLPDARLLAAARTAADQHLELLSSGDAGKSWQGQGHVTLAGQIPGHLLLLDDGRICLTYGVRNPGLRGVGMRLSKDGGRTWSRPAILVTLEGPDVGYPSSVVAEGGMIVTAYYTSSVAAHQRYHMGVLRWKAED